MAYRDTILGDTPVAYYEFTEASGTTATDQMGANNGTYTASGVTYSVAGCNKDAANKAVTFNGSSGGMTMPSGVNPASYSAFSFEIWINFAATPTGFQRILFSDDAQNNLKGFDVGVYPTANTGGIFFNAGCNNAWVQANYFTAVSTSTWHHVAGTITSTQVKLYVDGSLADTKAVTGTITATTGTIMVGRTSVQWFPGSVDEAAFYNYALSPGQIQAHYLTGTTGQRLRAISSRVRMAATNPQTLAARFLLVPPIRDLATAVRLRLQVLRNKVLSTRLPLQALQPRTLASRFVMQANQARLLASRLILYGLRTPVVGSRLLVQGLRNPGLSGRFLVQGLRASVSATRLRVQALSSRTISMRLLFGLLRWQYLQSRLMLQSLRGQSLSARLHLARLQSQALATRLRLVVGRTFSTRLMLESLRPRSLSSRFVVLKRQVGALFARVRIAATSPLGQLSARFRLLLPPIIGVRLRLVPPTVLLPPDASFVPMPTPFLGEIPLFAPNLLTYQLAGVALDGPQFASAPLGGTGVLLPQGATFTLLFSAPTTQTQTALNASVGVPVQMQFALPGGELVTGQVQYTLTKSIDLTLWQVHATTLQTIPVQRWRVISQFP